MAKKFNYSVDDGYTQLQVQMELLELLLVEDATYPWNIADPQSEIYFANQEQSFTSLDDPQEIVTGLDFFTQLEEIWSVIALPADDLSLNMPKNVPQNE